MGNSTKCGMSRQRRTHQQILHSFRKKPLANFSFVVYVKILLPCLYVQQIHSRRILCSNQIPQGFWPSAPLQMISFKSIPRALHLILVPLLLLQRPIRVHLAQLVFLDARRHTRSTRGMRWLPLVCARWLGGTQWIARSTVASMPSVRRVAAPGGSGAPDPREPTQQGTQGGSGGAEDGEAQLDVGPN